MHSISLTLDQLCAMADILLGLAHVDGDFDFLEAGEINDILTDLVEEGVPEEVSRRMAMFDSDSFNVRESCDLLIEEEVDSNAIVNLLIQIANADSVFDLSEHEYVSQVADLLGAPLEDLDEAQIEVIELAPPPIPN